MPFAVGNFQLRIKGTLQILKGGAWVFTGRATSRPGDTFDFQKSTHRKWYAETLTTLGRNLDIVGAKPYKVSIDGYQEIGWSSKHREPPMGLRVNPGDYPLSFPFGGNIW
jgi:hypothetical protein